MNCKIQTGINNIILRTKSEEIKEIDNEIISLAETLFKCMMKKDGVGLASPQIGINKRIIAVTQRKVSGKKYKFDKDLIMINPVISYFSDEKKIDEEGCLSVPGVTGDVERSKIVELDYIDLKGNELKLKVNGLNARIIQHEIDHLDGILFVDKLIGQKGLDINKFIKFGK